MRHMMLPPLRASVATVRHYVEHLEPEAKQRVASATEWTYGTLVDAQNRRCLIGHARDVKLVMGLPTVAAADLFDKVSTEGVAWAFDTIANSLGLPAAVALVKDAAGALK